MSKEQIEEMVKDLDAIYSTDFKGDYKSGLVDIAERLYNAGYRKQSEGEWKPIMTVCNRGACSECNEIGAARWKYCPNCGAKMKGGGAK